MLYPINFPVFLTFVWNIESWAQYSNMEVNVLYKGYNVKFHVQKCHLMLTLEKKMFHFSFLFFTGRSSVEQSARERLLVLQIETKRGSRGVAHVAKTPRWSVKYWLKCLYKVKEISIVWLYSCLDPPLETVYMPSKLSWLFSTSL